MRRLRRLTFLLFCFSLLAVSIPATGQQEKRARLYRYLIPDGYVGWVRVDFNVKEVAAPPVEGSFYILKIPKGGRLQTTIDDDEHMFTEDEYYYSCRDSKHLLPVDGARLEVERVWGNFQGPNVFTVEMSYKYRYFFVGPKEEYEKYQFSGENLKNIQLASDGGPKLGSVSTLTCQE